MWPRPHLDLMPRVTKDIDDCLELIVFCRNSSNPGSRTPANGRLRAPCFTARIDTRPASRTLREAKWM